MQFHISLVRPTLALLSKEVGKIDLNPGRGSWSKVVRAGGTLGLLELKQLVLDHLDLFLFSLLPDAHVFLLRRREVGLQLLDVVGISSEHSLVIHYVEGLSAFLLLGNGWVEHAVLGASVLVFVAHNLGLGSFETL